jgi:hypothetical protein
MLDSICHIPKAIPYSYGYKPWKSRAGELSFMISILSTFTKVAPL